MGKIRRGTITSGGASVDNLVNVSWRDESEFDRRRVDDEMAGKPVRMTKQGSGSIELLAGNIDTGYETNSLVVTYKEISVSSGVESEVEKTVTFSDVTYNSGGQLDNDAGPGSRTIEFQFGEVTEA